MWLGELVHWKFDESCDYVDWCICTLVDFVDDCEYLDYTLIACLTSLCLYTWWIYLMTIILVIVMRWNLYTCEYINSALFMLIMIDVKLTPGGFDRLPVCMNG